MLRNTVALIIFGGLTLASAEAGILYSTIPPQPLGSAPLVSWSYGATATAEYGNLIQLDPTGATAGAIDSATILMSNWSPSTTDYTVPLTLRLYSVGTLDPAVGMPPVGSLLATGTLNQLVQGRPANDPACLTGVCTSGIGFVTGSFGFDNTVLLSDLLGDRLIYGLSFAATGDAASLNIGLSQDFPTAGSNPAVLDPNLNPFNGAYLYTTTGPFATTSLAPDQNTDPNTPGSHNWLTTDLTGSALINQTGTITLLGADTPEPGTASIVILGLIGLGVGSFRRNRTAKRVDGEKGGKA